MEMTCSPEFVSEDVDSVSCRIEVENLDSMPVDIWITDVYFAGGKIYDRTEGDNLIAPNPESLMLNPDYSEIFTFTIPINGELQKRVPVDLSDIDLGTPIAIKAYLNRLKEPVTYVVKMNPREKGITEEVGDYIAGKVSEDSWGTAETIATIIVTGKIAVETNPSVWFLTIYTWALIESMKPLPPDTPRDNNLIVGDET
ncbi:hypothetical protein [Thermococcus barossii]|uniref:hypothetical protein n=1 Tax=Thermococcus barossii TaxID=54077 RepID=UPI0012FE5886|nr:hypothetical protein [Thermococcus barossii]